MFGLEKKYCNNKLLKSFLTAANNLNNLGLKVSL